MGFNTDDLYLGDLVTPIYRPDVKGVAYYEFQVLKGTRRQFSRTDLVENVAKVNAVAAGGYAKLYITPSLDRAKLEDGLRVLADSRVQGFIAVSTGPHDFPIPHWSLDHAPVSVALEARAKRKIKKVYKLDALAYVAEDMKGLEVSSVGQRPFAVNGLPDNPSKHAGKISSVEPVDFGRDAGPDEAKMHGSKMRKSGPRAPSLELKGFRSWASLKRGYKKTLGPLLEQLRARASESWAVELAVREFGEAIRGGQRRTFALLEPDAAVKVGGDGAKHVRVRIVRRPGDSAALELSCADRKFDREVQVEVEVRYGSGHKEELRFFLYSPDTPTRNPSTTEED